MDISPDAEDLAVKLISEHAERVRREAERIAVEAKADRVSTTFVEQAATMLGARRRSSSLSGVISSAGVALSGASIGLTAGVLVSDGPGTTPGLLLAVTVGVVGLGLLLVGAVRSD